MVVHPASGRTDGRALNSVGGEEDHDGDRTGGQTVRLPAVVTLERDDLGDVYVARCLAVEVASHGDTQQEALANFREALELYFEDSPSRRST
jgi:predicted RNase H-like HicB family nuclease